MSKTPVQKGFASRGASPQVSAERAPSALPPVARQEAEHPMTTAEPPKATTLPGYSAAPWKMPAAASIKAGVFVLELVTGQRQTIMIDGQPRQHQDVKGIIGITATLMDGREVNLQRVADPQGVVDYAIVPEFLPRCATSAVRAKAIAPRVSKSFDAEDKPWISLGCYKENFYFYPIELGQVISFRAIDKRMLSQLAPLQYWREAFGSYDGTVAWEDAQNFVREDCRKKGLYFADSARGRGLWKNEDGKVIAHLGDRLYFDGRESTTMLHDGMVYERGRKLNVSLSNPLTTDDCRTFLDCLGMFPWTNERFLPIYAGWCVIAHIAGALEFRPHLWVIGKAESGKSTLINYVTKRVLSNCAINAAGDSSMAGIEQTLKTESRPVLFDEIENDTSENLRRIQAILRMARHSSTETGAEVLKGGQDGKPRGAQIRSCFAFSSINATLTHESNASRVEVVEVDRALFAHSPNDVKEACYKLSGEYGARFAGRAIKMVDVVSKNLIIFGEIFRKKLGANRDGDLLGTLMAGYCALIMDGVIDREEAIELVNGFNWTVERERVNDQADLWRAIMAAQIPIELDRRTFHVPVGRLLDIVEGSSLDDNIQSRTAEKGLGSWGIKLITAPRVKNKIAISNNSQMLQRYLENTKWAGGWRTTLKNIKGATSSESALTFGTRDSLSRAIIIPADYLRDEPVKAQEDMGLEGWGAENSPPPGFERVY